MALPLNKLRFAPEHGQVQILSIANRFDELARVAAWLEQTAAQYQWPEALLFRLDIVLNEALPNIISYAYADQSPHTIRVSLEDWEDRVALEIVDDGMAFDPFEATPLPQPESLESASVQGRGIGLIRAYTDEREHRRINNVNSMRVVFRKPS
jgi:anti-sigma regulatory factor (Ser/Thr protein kinase)